MKLKNLVQVEMNEEVRDNPRFDPEIGFKGVLDFLDRTGLGELSLVLLRTHLGEPFLTFAIWENDAVQKCMEYIEAYHEAEHPDKER